MIGISDHYKTLWHTLRRDKKQDILDQLIKNSAALKLKQLIDYFGELYVGSIALNVTVTVGGRICVLAHKEPRSHD